MVTTINFFSKTVRFYLDGFANMRLGKSLWILIGIKLFILFAVVKVFFFPNFLETHFDNDLERSAYVLDQLTHTTNTNKEK